MKKTDRKLRTTRSALVAAAVVAALVALPTAALATNPEIGNSTAMTSDTNGNASGSISVTYDTSGGTWVDPDDPDHPQNSGTYRVYVPASITWSGMSIGNVDVNTPYNVIVRGVLPSGKSVKLTAASGVTLSFGTNSTITEHTHIGANATDPEYSDTNYRTFTAAQAGVLNNNGQVQGTTVQDNISLTGTASASGAYRGSVQYSASLIDAS